MLLSDSFVRNCQKLDRTVEKAYHLDMFEPAKRSSVNCNFCLVRKKHDTEELKFVNISIEDEYTEEIKRSIVDFDSFPETKGYFNLVTISTKVNKCAVLETIWNEGKRESYILKVYGEKTKAYLDRSIMIIMMQNMVGKQFFNSRLVTVFNNAAAYQFYKGRELCRPIKTIHWQESANLVAALHRMPLSCYPGDISRPCIYGVFEKMLNLLDGLNLKNLEVENLSKEMFQTQFSWLIGEIGLLNFEMVICHNDLRPSNFVYGDDGLKIIDYELCGPNYWIYDLANLICEYSVILPLMYGFYPYEPIQNQWMEVYLPQFESTKNMDYEFVRTNLRLFILLSHLFWSLWATVHYFDQNPDYDFKTVVKIRLSEYKRIKGEVYKD
ncbi:Ethanolamine kinase 2 [Thelohanellus kitauei]|uniref:ethanolamine kinase n=1 Tax=Thelohanellus kitauei TaxID=669202 RepID=A0A0C2MPE8_THEKT|nr:Ethanolamine kinase 2 [Thelohanellus kitauei]